MQRQWFLVAVAGLVAGCAGARGPSLGPPPPPFDPSIDAEVERLFTHPYPEGEIPSSLSFSPDGRLLGYLRTVGRGDDAVAELWLLDAETRAERPLWQDQSNPVSAYEWFPDGERVLVQSEAGLVVVGVADRSMRRIPCEPAGATESPVVSPDGRLVAFVRDHDVWAIDVAAGVERRLTTGGSEALRHGESDWVLEEELELAQGLYFSPDGTRLAFLEIDESSVSTHPIERMSDTGPVVEQQRYPLPGGTNPAIRVGVLRLDVPEPAPTWLDLGIEQGGYVARIAFLPDGRHLAAVTLNRAQTVLRLVSADVETGASTVVLEERDDAWLNVLDPPRFLRDGQSLLWRSERDGHAHLYVLGTDGTVLRQLTTGPFEVEEVVDLDESAGMVRFLANRDSRNETRLYSVPLQGGDVTLLSLQQGCHEVTFSPDHARYVDVHSSLSRPPRAELFGSGGEPVAVVAAADLAQLSGLERTTAELLQVDGADGERLDARMIRPTRLEPGRRYPVVVWIYAGPRVQIARNEWRTRYIPWMRLLAERGLLVFSLDGRGSGGRGRAFERHIHRRLGAVELEDQLAGVRYLRSLPYVDSSRIGLFGWSYGGTMTLNALLRPSGIGMFRAGVAVAPVTDWRLYDSIYTERYMGLPAENQGGYDAAEVVGLAPLLDDRLLLIHGLADDNVHFENSARLVSALVAARRSFDLMVYPGEGHPISGGPARRHVFALITRYLLSALGTEPGMPADRGQSQRE